jgi:glycosyltransferase involved in cell wall biosynthesis
MKVIISTRAIYPFHGYGGMERYFYYLAKHLIEHGIDVEIVTSGDGSGKKTAEYSGVPYIFLPPNFYKKPWILVWYRLFNLNVKKYLEKSDFDILHGCGGTYPYVLLKNRAPVIFQPFGMEIFKSRGLQKLYAYISYYRTHKKLLEHADAIASEGEIQTQEIVDLFKVPKEKIFSLPDGVDLSEIEDYLNNAEITREDLGLQDADLVLINVNRLAPNKGISYLIDALKILNTQLNVKLLLIGAGPEERKIKQQIKSLGLENKVLHFKNIPDEKMFQLYTLTDISVTPTLYEGLPLVVLEAMACGKPIVASNVSEVPQVVKHGKNGFLVPPRNPSAIADAVFKIYEKNLFKNMGIRSKEIVKNYDWSIIAKKAINKYEELVKK